MPLRIIELETSGFRALKAVEITFENGINVIQGATRQGKTSIIDDLFLMFKGLRGQSRDLIPHGESLSENRVLFSNDGVQYEITRVLKADAAPALELRELIPGTKPRKRSAPQTFLDTLLPAMGETPGTFLKKSANDKLKFILERHDADVSAEQKAITDAKTKKDELVIQQKLYAGCELVPKPSENSVKKAAVQKSITEAAEHNTAVAARYAELKKAKTEAYSAGTLKYKEYKNALDKIAPSETALATAVTAAAAEQAAITKLEEEIARRKKALVEENERIQKETAKINDAKAALTPVTEPDYPVHTKELEELSVKEASEKKDVAALESELKTFEAEDTAAADYLRKHKAWHEKAAEIETANAEYKAAKDRLKAKLAAIPCKLEGLEVVLDDDNRPDGIYLHGIFSEEWSGAEGLLASSMILRRYTGQDVIIIDGGESIHNDKKAFEMFCNWAREDNVQVIISVVSETPGDDTADRVLYVENGGVRVIK